MVYSDKLLSCFTYTHIELVMSRETALGRVKKIKTNRKTIIVIEIIFRTIWDPGSPNLPRFKNHQ